MGYACTFSSYRYNDLVTDLDQMVEEGYYIPSSTTNGIIPRVAELADILARIHIDDMPFKLTQAIGAGST
jgi:hypothetical protein